MSVSQLATLLVSPPMFFFALGAVGLWVSRTRQQAGRRIIGAAVALLYLCSTPLVARTLSSLAQAPYQDPLASTTPGVAIVVLGGGVDSQAPEYGGPSVSPVTLARIRYAAYLHRLTGAPLMVTGGDPRGEGVKEGEVMKDVLQKEFYLPVALVENEGRTTYESAVFVSRLLGSAKGPVYLVTDALHMRRAVRAFERQGVMVIPAATLYGSTFSFSISDLLPSAVSMRAFSHAQRELIGYIWYELRY